jgi:YVTN family beta-propeller protein
LAVFEDGGGAVRVVGPARRALLAILLLHAREVVTADHLIDELWGDRAPATASKSLQMHVWRLRTALGDQANHRLLSTDAGGYVLRVAPGRLDLEVFERLLCEGRRALEDGRAEPASAALAEALALWRGPALAEFADEPFARAARARLEELHLEAVEARIDADLLLGRDRALVAELESLVSANPLRERLEAQLMLALYRCGRQADALTVYREARRLLDGELGLEPGEELRALEGAVLAHDPCLKLGSDQPDGMGPQLGRPPAGESRPLEARSRSRAWPPIMALNRRWRGGLLVAAGGAALLATIAAVVVRLSAGIRSHVEISPNAVAVIDERSDNVVGAVGVGARPGGIAFGSGAVWVNDDDRTVSRINPTSLRTVRTLPVAGTPTGIAASRGAVWVAESVPSASAVSVRRVDPEFNSLGRAVPLGNVDRGGPAAIAARGNAVWVAPSSGLLTNLDAVTGRPGRAVSLKEGATAVDVGDGAVWLADGRANDVTRVDPTGLLTQIAVGDGPNGIAVGAGGVWVADSLANKVTRIDSDSRSVADTIQVGRSPCGVAVGAGFVWVANRGDGTVTRIDPLTNSVRATVSVGGSPQAIAVADGRVWVTLDAKTIEAAVSDSTRR